MAGLLDFLQTGDSGGGLLDLLRRSALQQQFSSGLPSDQAQYDAPILAPTAPIQNIAGNNQPSPLDTAQYPAGPIGAPSNAMAQAPQSQLPVNAQATQGQLPQAAPQVSGPGIGDRLMAGFQGFANGGGVLPALANGLTGLVTGQRSDAAGIAQQSANMTAKALLAKGVDPNVVQAAIGNKELMDTILKQTFGPQTVQSLGNGYIADRNGKVTRAYQPDDNNQVVKIGQDSLGREQYGIFNKTDGSIKPYTPPSAAPGQDPLGNTNLSGKEYLDTLPKEQANTVQMMVEGKIPPPTSFAMSKPYWQNMIAAARNYDPTFDATEWSKRVAGAKDFSAGKSAEMVRSANQTIHHVGALLDSMDKLDNGNIPIFNTIGNTIAEARGSGAQGAFRTNAHAVAEELSKVFKGSNLSDAEIRAWEQNLHENMSPEQQRTQVAKLAELLQGSLHALDEKRVASIGPIAAEKAGPIIKDEGQRVLERIDNWVKNNGAKPTSAASQPAPAAAPDRSAIEAEMKRRGLL